ncbi:MAG TPA: HEAT repeat domain-containing protein, partial [Anaerolineales bacterium]|nr:HEAT repeat domain-containing protein [Anaerolineales bacterium]
MSQTIAASLLKELTGGVDERAEAAARALARYGLEVLPALQELLHRPDPDLRWWATRALAEIDDPQVVSLLLESLQDPDALIRQCAALALRQQPSFQAVPGLAQAL